MRKPTLRQAIDPIRRAIAAYDLVCSGTVTQRWKKCGKANCRCAKDPAARHGPYFEWGRLENGRLRHSLLTQKQAARVAAAIENHKQVLALLARWRLETQKLINAENND